MLAAERKGGGIVKTMLLILGCLHPIPLHQDRQYHKPKTGWSRQEPLPLPASLPYPARIAERLSIAKDGDYQFREAYKPQGKSWDEDA